MDDAFTLGTGFIIPAVIGMAAGGMFHWKHHLALIVVFLVAVAWYYRHDCVVPLDQLAMVVRDCYLANLLGNVESSRNFNAVSGPLFFYLGVISRALLNMFFRLYAR